jgi:hypothetical protein
MDFDKLRAELADLLADETLFEETRLHDRMEAIELIDYVGEALRVPGREGLLEPVYQQALGLRTRLIAANEVLFQRVRTDLLSGNYTPAGLRATFDQFVNWKVELLHFDYDSLDTLLENTIFRVPTPSESRQREHGMVRYEASAGRIVLEMIDVVKFIPSDVFVDIGSGLGLVVILVNLLTGVCAIGIEYDPAYHAYAQARAGELGLQNVTFINADARQVDFSQGNMFYLFTPFIDEVFDTVLERLRQQTKHRKIYLCSYGTITHQLVELSWLQILDPAMESDFKLAIFTSIV